LLKAGCFWYFVSGIVNCKLPKQYIKRISNYARQKGEEKIEEGNQEFSFALYIQCNAWCVAEGTRKSNSQGAILLTVGMVLTEVIQQARFV